MHSAQFDIGCGCILLSGLCRLYRRRRCRFVLTFGLAFNCERGAGLVTDAGCTDGKACARKNLCESRTDVLGDIAKIRHSVSSRVPRFISTFPAWHIHWPPATLWSTPEMGSQLQNSMDFPLNSIGQTPPEVTPLDQTARRSCLPLAVCSLSKSPPF